MPRTKDKKSLYRITTVDNAKLIAFNHLVNIELDKVIDFGLPEIDDRFHIWRVPLRARNGDKVGEVVIDAISTFVDIDKTTSKSILEDRLLGRNWTVKKLNNGKDIPHISTLRNTIALGDAELLLKETPNESVDLIFTSPPYYNAKPEYTECNSPHLKRTQSL